MLPRLRLTARHLKPATQRQPKALLPRKATMSTFTIPDTNLNINSTPDLTRDDLLSFPAFKIWISTLQRSLAQQENPSHEFHGDPYILRKIDIQSVDRFGGGRLGFVKLKADVSNSSGEKLPGSVFLRGGSVGMLVRCSSPDMKLEWKNRLLTRSTVNSSTGRCSRFIRKRQESNPNNPTPHPRRLPLLRRNPRRHARRQRDIRRRRSQRNPRRNRPLRPGERTHRHDLISAAVYPGPRGRGVLAESGVSVCWGQ